MTWTAQAEAFAESLPELGMCVAGLNAAAWGAGVDPMATSGLVGAALALGASQSDLFPRGQIVNDDREMLTCNADMESDAAELFKQGVNLGSAVESALGQAQRAAAAAAARQRTATTKGEEAAAARELARAQREIADCECALEILEQALPRLDYARACLSRVPDDLLTTYEAPYELVRRGGKLPYSGEFLTAGATGGPA